MKTLVALFAIILSLPSCSDPDSDRTVSGNNPGTTSPTPVTPTPTPYPGGQIHYLALGDSYTIGQNVCETCRFPEQLKARLEPQFSASVSLEIIAVTGWTTSNLISAISARNPSAENDLVTLLIGVNNQYQGKAFSVYETEFPQLVDTAISLAKNEKKRVIVVSIPDYAFTPYGQAASSPSLISSQIDQYNDFARGYCEQNGIAFVDITDITRQGISNPSLVASDGLHPSSSAYSLFVDRIFPKAVMGLQP